MASTTFPDPVTLVPTSEKTAPPVLQPMDVRTVFLGILVILSLLTIAKLAHDIVLPFLLAVMLKLALQPFLYGLEKLKLPRRVAALAVLLALIGGIATLGMMLSGPMTLWAERLPVEFPHVRERLDFISTPMQKTQKMLVKADDLAKTDGAKVMPVVIQGTRVSDRIMASTQTIAGEFFTTMLLLYFMLAAGDTFLRRLVEILPRFQDKRQAVDISQRIQNDIATYLITITTINACVGIAAGLAIWACGVDDGLLWGTLAFLLNFVPLIGPLIGIGIFVCIGFAVIPDAWSAAAPALIYFIIHIIEGSFVTPLLLARRLTLNPVLVVLSLVFWYWMWGVPGAILAVPMLAVTKIICDRITPLNAFGHFLGG